MDRIFREVKSREAKKNAESRPRESACVTPVVERNSMDSALQDVPVQGYSPATNAVFLRLGLLAHFFPPIRTRSAEQNKDARARI